MWKFNAVYFCVLLSALFTVTNLEAINKVNDVHIFNSTTTLNRANVSQNSILDEISTIFGIVSQSPSNCCETVPNEAKKITKRNVLNMFGEGINFQVELGPFGYGKIILFAIVRIFIGIALDKSKLQQIIRRPIGPLIAILCHCIFLPSLSYGFGWIFFADRTAKRLDFFECGYSIGLHTFVFEPGYVIVDHTRYVVLILSNCLTLLLGGSIEQSLWTNVHIVLLSHFVGTERQFWLYEQIFNSNDLYNRFRPATSSGYNFIGPLCISIILSLFGLCIQHIWPQSKRCAMTILKRISIIYVLFVLIISYSYLFIMFGYSILMSYDYKNSSHLAANLITILIDLFGHSLSIFGFVIGYYLAKMLKQKTDQCIAIAVESIAQNLFLDITLLPLALCLCRCRRQQGQRNDAENLTNDACHETEFQTCTNEI